MRSPYVKVYLSQDPKTNLSNAKVVGQGDDYLLLERAAPKARAAAATTRKRAPRKAQAPAQVGATEQSHGA